jgi:hypothetical protein
MFGSLLGHLQKAKKEEEALISTPTMQKRAEMDVKAETKAAGTSCGHTLCLIKKDDVKYVSRHFLVCLCREYHRSS